MSGLDRLGISVLSYAHSRALYEAALAPFGLRPNDHPNYHAAFVIDPDGHNIEAVYHGAE